MFCTNQKNAFSFTKVVFFSLIANTIPLKNRENRTSSHYCISVAHFTGENQ